MTTLKHKLLTIADAFQAGSGLSRARVSTLAFNDGKVIDRLHAESDITTGRYERALLWFSANWPSETKWPTDVPRPAGLTASVAPEPARPLA